MIETIRTRAPRLALGLALAALAFSAAAQQDGDAGAVKVTAKAAAQLTLDDLRTFTDVFNQVRRNYVEEVGDHELLDSAIRGMLMELDPHSAYLPAETFQDLQDSSRGRYRGIGVDVRAEDGRLVVKAIINGSPADRAGIEPGDRVTSIDDKPVRGRHLPDAIDDLMGEPGTTVDLVLQSPDGTVRSVTVEREYLQVPTLSYQLLDQRFGYFKMTQFHRDSASDMKASLDSIAAEGTELAALVIDLRGNPGGVLDGAVELADGFLDDGVILSTRGRNGSLQASFEAKPGQWREGIPVMVLVDRASASASEVFAGALQDHGRGVIVGERTFGKGSVQTVLPLRNGGGIKLTTARYYTPSGRSIQAEGIVPDILYARGGLASQGREGRREVDLEGHLGPESPAGDSAPGRATTVAGDVPIDEMLAALEQAGLLTQPPEAPAAETAGGRPE